jgi:hypothetical protein
MSSRAGSALSIRAGDLSAPARIIRTGAPERATGPGFRRGPSRLVWSDGYLIRSKILKMGMYRAMIIDPMMPPSMAIMSGSISAVNDSVVASTSWS